MIIILLIYSQLINCKCLYLFQVAKVCPKDKDAQKKFSECKKLVHQQAFAQAIAIDDNKASLVDSLDLESMSKLNFVSIFKVNFLL